MADGIKDDRGLTQCEQSDEHDKIHVRLSIGWYGKEVHGEG